MTEGYSEHFIDHMREPRNTGPLPGANGVAESRNPVCGDFLRLMVRIDSEAVGEARFEAQGCGGAVAAASLLTETVRGLTVEQALALTREGLAQTAGGLPASKLHVAALAIDALRAAIVDWAAHQR